VLSFGLAGGGTRLRAERGRDCRSYGGLIDAGQTDRLEPTQKLLGLALLTNGRFQDSLGAAVGAVTGTVNEALKKHGVEDDDVGYYNERLKGGGVFVSADIGTVG
jgi:hypothetical protein